jgi:hypothetical protein
MPCATYGNGRPPRRPSYAAARRIEQLLALEPGSLHGIDRRARDGAFVLRFDPQRLTRSGGYRRQLRIPARRVFGYRQVSATARPRDVRARRKANAERFWMWLLWRVDPYAPILDRPGHLDAIEELRRLILELTPPDALLVIPMWRAPA